MSTPLRQSPNKHSPLPAPGTAGYDEVPQFLMKPPLPFRRTIRRHELHQIVPLAETTIYEMEQRGQFPRRFRLTSRSAKPDQPTGPDVRLRQYRPVRRDRCN